MKDVVECYLGREVFPEYKQLEGWDFALTCVSAVGLDDTILKYGFKGIASTTLGKKAIKRVEAFVTNYRYTTRIKAKLSTLKGADLQATLARLKNRLGPDATPEEVEDLIDVCVKSGAKTSDDFDKFSALIGDTGRLKRFKDFADKLEPIEAMMGKLRKLEGEPRLSARLEETFQSYEFFITEEPIYLVRYYDTQKAGKLGGFWGNRIYTSKEDFYIGSVVFPEWSQAERMVLIRVEKGEKIALGKINGQSIKTVDGSKKSLAASDEYQFLLPAQMDSDFIKAGGQAENWITYLANKLRIKILQEDLELPSEW